MVLNLFFEFKIQMLFSSRKCQLLPIFMDQTYPYFRAFPFFSANELYNVYREPSSHKSNVFRRGWQIISTRNDVIRSKIVDLSGGEQQKSWNLTVFYTRDSLILRIAPDRADQNVINHRDVFFSLSSFIYFFISRCIPLAVNPRGYGGIYPVCCIFSPRCVPNTRSIVEKWT